MSSENIVVMAAVIEGDVKKNLLDRTEAEKVFRPWWDTLEDYLLNILIVIGRYCSLNREGFIHPVSMVATRYSPCIYGDHQIFTLYLWEPPDIHVCCSSYKHTYRPYWQLCAL